MVFVGVFGVSGSCKPDVSFHSSPNSYKIGRDRLTMDTFLGGQQIFFFVFSHPPSIMKAVSHFADWFHFLFHFSFSSFDDQHLTMLHLFSFFLLDD